MPAENLRGWSACLLVLVLLLPLQVAAQTVVLGDAVSGVPLNARSDWLRDDSASLSPAGLGEPAVQQQFQQGAAPSSAGLTTAAYWLRITLQRPEAELGRHWWLVVEPLKLFDLRLYLPGPDGQLQERLSGDRMPFAVGRDLDYRQFAFRLPDTGTQPLTLYLRSQDPGGLSFPVSLWREEQLHSHVRGGELLLGLVYGLLLGLSAYNLFLALTLRDKAYFMYVGATFSLTLYLFHMYGHSSQYFWPEWPWLVSAARVMISSMWGIFVGLFVMAFFQSRQFTPVAHRLLWLTCCVYGVIIGLRLTGLHGPVSVLLNLLTPFAILLVLFIAITRWRQGFSAARFFLLGYGVLLACTSLIMLRINGVLAPSRLTEFSLPVGAAFESLVFSLALADRIRLLRRDGEAAYRDELTALGNRRELERRFDLHRALADQQGSHFALLALDLDHFKPINDRYGHAAGDLVLKVIGQRLLGCVRDKDLVTRVGGDEFLVLLATPSGMEVVEDAMRRIRKTMLHPINIEDQQLSVGTSIGHACYPQDGKTLADLSRQADIALYAAKRSSQAPVSAAGESVAGFADQTILE